MYVYTSYINMSNLYMYVCSTHTHFPLACKCVIQKKENRCSLSLKLTMLDLV